MKLAKPAEFARLIALWCARNISAAIAQKFGLSELKGRLSGLPDNAPISEIKAAADAAAYAAAAYAADAADAADAASGAYAAYAAYAAAAAAGLPQFQNLVGQAILDAWLAAGGEIEPLRRPGINQLLVCSAKQHGLDMSTWHCGTAHCIAGWYSTLSGAPEIEAKFSCWLAAVLTFAVNNPGEPMPYMGSNQEQGLAELTRLESLNPIPAV